MRARLAACLILASPALAACGGGVSTPAQAGPDEAFASAVEEYHLPLNPRTAEAIDAAKETCEALETGTRVSTMRRTVAEILQVTGDQALDFVTASVYAYCPDAI